MKNSILIKLSISLIILLSVGFSCQQKKSVQSKDTNDQGTEKLAPEKISFVSPKNGDVIKIGNAVKLQVQVLDTTAKPDSVQFLVDAIRVASLKKIDEPFKWTFQECKVGDHVISSIVYFSSGSKEQSNIEVKVYPAKQPILYGYKIISTYHHDDKAYTQGLLYDNGELIESTGLKGQSSLRRVKFQTGEILKLYNLPNDIFGEGIALFDNKILQISWQDQVAFLYDKPTFSLINKLSYPFKEGWGLTYDGKNLIMSDGSSNLYFLNKEDFTEISRVEVCDNKGPVQKLNELEYVDGEIWANIYYTDTIVRIDPKTGIILGKIDMSGLLKAEDQNAETNVLNGIAYDPSTKRIWVTGKNWPKLFQISIHQKDR